MKDFYYILGTDENCTFDAIKDAYRKLSKKFHPDLNQNDKYFESRFREIQEAYETLIDPIMRVKYDAALKRSRVTTPPPFTTYTYYKPPGAQAKKRAAAINRSKTGRVDILFTIILIFITLLFADYVIKAMTGPTHIVKVKSIPVASTVAYALPKHHKKRHNVKYSVANELPGVYPIHTTSKLSLTNANISPVKALPAINSNSTPNTPVMVRPVESNPGFLYATYVKANMTGVVNMRESAAYGADVVKEIPGNSKVFVLAKGNTYYKVLFDNETGYVPKWTLETK